MKKNFFMSGTLLMAGIILLAGCSQAPTPAPILDTPPAPAATYTPTAVPPTPAEEPILPCNITFESDRDGNLEVYTMNPDGTQQLNLTNHPGDDFAPVWSPDGTHIAFASNRGAGGLGGQFIFVMLADGNGVVQVSHQDGSNFPDWSPLGTQIAYSSQGDIYLVDISGAAEINLTNSPGWDEQPKFSPDGQRIAWLEGENGSRQIYTMDLDGANVVQVTHAGNANDLEWTVDGRIFTHWNQPDGICFNCVVTADGKEITDAGGKGTIQQFLPFWTAGGDRVELASGDVNGSGHEDIFLVGEIFPGLFEYLTGDAGNNRNPDTAAMCGPNHGAGLPSKEVTGTPAAGEPPASADRFVIGYTGSINPVMQKDFDQACSELEVECVHGENITQLADQGVDAIVNASNRWDVMGSYPAIHDAASRGIPLFILNAESTEPGVYNLSAENEIYTTTLNWFFKNMDGQGGFVYYNFGSSDYIQQIVDAVLEEYPGITALKKEAGYDANPFSGQDIQAQIAGNPSLGAIWSSEPSTDLFWALVDKANTHIPLTECPARKDMLLAWKNELDAGSALRCISHVRPGGTAYEGIYVAYYHLSGLQLDPEKLGGEAHNTLHYAVPEITNETLPEWLNKLDSFRPGENETLQLQPMDPSQIKNEWFIE